MAVRDTSLAATRRYYDHLRRLSPQERLECAASLSSAVRELAKIGARMQFPTASPAQIRALVAERMYGRVLAERFFARELRELRELEDVRRSD